MNGAKDGPVVVARTPWVDEPGAAHAVALEILLNGPIARTAIARRLNLSAGSLTRLTKPMIDSGLVAETGPPDDSARRAGRPTKPLEIVGSARHFIGLKVTGEHVIGVLTDLRATVVATAARTIPSHAPERVGATVVDVVTELGQHDHPVSALGIGIGGLVREHNIVVSAPFLGWEDVPFGDMVEAATGLPTTLENDVIAFTAYENWFGAGRGFDRFAVITLGAGIGYGLVVHGEPVIDVDSGLGLVGHWPLDPYGPVCPAGHRGCARSIMTSAAITSGVSTAIGREVDYAEALALAASDPAARRVVDDAGRGLGRLIAAVANLCAPELVVLGGEGVRLAAVAAESVQAGLRADRNPLARPVPLVMTGGDDLEWGRGAAVIAIRSYVLAGAPS